MNDEQWDESTDVVVVGFGAAGATAAVVAAEAGAAVVAVDRWGHGGASARSGGIVYAGGGTPQQAAAGFDDDPHRMLAYLAAEETVGTDDERLERFCSRSRDDLGWLEAHGVRFAHGFDPTKSVVPVDNATGLYYSGNEKHFAEGSTPIPRGHRVAGVGMTGHDLVAALHGAARAAGVDVRAGVRLLDLVTGPDGGVTGVEVLVLDQGLIACALHEALYRMIDVSAPLLRHVPAALSAALDRLERRTGRVRRIGARRGVVLATGGFAFNRTLLDRHAPAYARSMPLGTPGDDGSGILAAERVGGALRLMDHCGASRFIAPPVAFCSGVLVDGDGERICDESLYAATLSARIAERGGIGWLIVDTRVRREAREQIRAATRLRTRPLHELLSGRANHVLFPRLFGSINLYANRVTAPTLAELARRCGLPPDTLRATIGAYNQVVHTGVPDPLGKPTEHLHAIEHAPYAAVRCHLDGVLFPAPTITLGGLDVDAGTQLVRRADRSVIPGLHAVGRCASGVTSRSYVSGLSLADCVRSGRTAGEAATTSRRERASDAATASP